MSSLFKKRNYVGTAIRKLTLCGLLAALGIILGRSFMTVYITPSFKITLDKLPVILAGVWLGPVYGAAVAAVSDIIGAAALSSFGWTPLLTVSPMLMGVISGLLGIFIKKPEYKTHIIIRTASIVVLTEIFTSVLLQTYFLTRLYGGTYSARLALRAPVCAVVAAVETAAISLLELSPAVNAALKKFVRSYKNKISDVGKDYRKNGGTK